MTQTAFLLLVSFLYCVEFAFPACQLKVIDGTQCTAPNGVTIPAGGELIIPDQCEKCSCTSPGHDSTHVAMSCCGYGIHGGVIAAPAGCKMVAGDDGCSVRFVLISDESQNCTHGHTTA